MDRRTLIGSIASSVLLAPVSSFAQTQQSKVYRVGVVLSGGWFYTLVDGLKEGLKELGFEEGKQYVLEIRDVKGDPKAIEAAARSLARENVNLIYALGSSVALRE
jgi:ABC-type uncharacterized transport system substrate-binding protein